jgi:hypothetical protein
MIKILTANRSDDSGWPLLLRVGAGVALAAKIIFESQSLDLLYSSNGLVPETISSFSQNPFIPALLNVYHFVSNILTESHFLFAFFGFQLLFALLLLLGVRSRTSAFICWAMQVVVFNSTHLTSYGFDAILLSLLFYCMIFPVGKYFAIKPLHNTMIPIYQKVLQLHICLIYLANGISKVSGHTWLDGSGIWDAVNQPQFDSALTPIFQKILLIGHMPAIITWSTIIIEIAYPFLIWVWGVNKIALSLIILLHVFIAVVFGLWLFAFVMIVFNLTAFGDILLKPQKYP